MPRAAADFTFAGAKITISVGPDRKVASIMLHGQSKPTAFPEFIIDCPAVRIDPASVPLAEALVAKIIDKVLDESAKVANAQGGSPGVVL